MGRNRMLLLSGVLAFSACKGREMELYRVPKQAAQTAAPAHDHAHGHEGRDHSAHEHPPAPQADAMAAGTAGLPAPPPGSIHWTKPSGWTQKPAGGMRFATLGVPTQAGEAELAVVMLAGDAGGNLANVNRWRGQLGLDPIDDSQLARVSESVKSLAGTSLVVQVAGADGKSGLLAAILPQAHQTWFFKLTGNSGATREARPAFLKFLASLR